MLDNKHIIAYLDILGFKSIIKKSTNHDYIKNLKIFLIWQKLL